ncbi:DUF4198 domain-containing protein [uncultured Sulfitobacter sp.]|uniref:DUF4198 domain-containing protein n=1 Tax=uncultured Sulfitobacter sp. TaxID=191468 RepID=UPI0026286DA5|nr:DUF4198 domain-containing protein [uncultured Sulfitobacter sp.]
MNIKHFLSIGCTVLFGVPAFAHEFWIEPIKFQVESDAPVHAQLRNGELFSGSAQPFFPQRNTRFEAVLGEKTIKIEGRMGDRPAVQLSLPGGDGLLIIAHEAAPASVTYEKWSKFVAFTEHKDFTDAVSIHEARDWDKENFEETYTRHSKSLIAVGNGEGTDRPMGLLTEFIARENPYAADFDGTLDVSLMYKGAPRADAQIEVYAKTDAKEVTVSVVRTDAQGNASIPVEPGLTYLLDAVVLRPVADATTVAEGPVWETLWASMTFAVPAK